jgi:hypothetical protein
MRRREFIVGTGSVAAWPLVARAQQGSGLTVGVLGGGEPEGLDRYLSGFAQALAETATSRERTLQLSTVGHAANTICSAKWLTTSLAVELR